MIKRVSIFLAFMLLFIVVVIQFNVNRFQELKLQNMPSYYEVKLGTGLNQLCHEWLTNGHVDSCFALKLYGRLYPDSSSLIAGVYELQNLTILDAVFKVHQGEQKQFSFTLIEGETLKNILDKLKSAPYINYDIDEASLSKHIGVSDYPEGWLLPETYFYLAHSSALDVISRAHNAMKEELNKAWNNKLNGLPLRNQYEALILASIIEKETGYVDERKKIASVFINRLNKRMRLQTDPTVIYGLGERFDGDIKRKDLNEYTPYNTYRINGLPPTPIAMPSKEALIAATQPETTDYFYFVAKGNGQHQFSKNLADHNKAVKRYILKRSNDS